MVEIVDAVNQAKLFAWVLLGILRDISLEFWRSDGVLLDLTPASSTTPIYFAACGVHQKAY